MTNFSNAKKNDWKGAVVFDFDGTLIDSMHFVAECCSKVLHQHVTCPKTKEHLQTPAFFQEKFASRHNEMFNELDINDPKVMAEVWMEWLRWDNERLHEFKLFPDVEPMLQNLCAQGLKLFIWTAREGRTTAKIFENLHLSRYISDLRFGDYGEHENTAFNDTVYDQSKKAKRKPYPDALISLLAPWIDETNFKRKQDVLMVGDSVQDIEGARRFGCASIGAAWCESASAENLQRSGATMIARTPKECEAQIIKYFKDKMHV